MKLEFSNTDRLEAWLSDVVSSAKYDLYYDTLDRRLMAIKNVSTEPRLHAIVDNVDIDEAHELADNQGRELTIAKTFEWSHEATESSND